MDDRRFCEVTHTHDRREGDAGPCVERKTLLTGRYAWRTRLTSGVFDGFSPPLIEPDRVTVASFLRDHGYATACIGKWHVGLQWTRVDGGPESDDRADPPEVRPGYDIDFAQPFGGGPLALGFDRFFGISASLNMPPFCFLEGDRPLVLPTLRQGRIRDAMFAATDEGVRSPAFTNRVVMPRLAGEAVRWIEARARRPSLTPVARRLTGENSCRPMTTGQSFRRHPTFLRVIDIHSCDGIPCHGADGPREEGFQGRSTPTRKIRP